MASPSIILIALDDMRADEWDALPQTRALVGGTWVGNFTITTPVCAPSRSTVLTGRYTHNHRVLRNDGGHNAGRPAFRPHEDRTIATLLQGAGYYTALVGKYMNQYDKRQSDPPGWDVFAAADPPRYGEQQGRQAARVASIASAERDQPCFVYWSPKAPHGPINGIARVDLRPRDYAKYARSRREKLQRFDDAVARLATAMGDRWNEAVVIVVSDNGYLIGEHRLVGKQQPWHECTNVPALFRVPGLAAGDDTRMLGTIDIAPTILRAAGVEVPTWMDGMAAQDGTDREAILIECWPQEDPTWRGVRTANELYVEWGGIPSLFDRRDDPGEARDILPGADETRVAWLRDETLRQSGCVGRGCR